MAEDCPHDVEAYGLCAYCGKDMTECVFPLPSPHTVLVAERRPAPLASSHRTVDSRVFLPPSTFSPRLPSQSHAACPDHIQKT